MDDKLAHIAAIAGRNQDVANKLDQVLVGPNDRAYVVCTSVDCHQNLKGRCTIFTVLDVPRMKTQPCERYETAVREG